MPFLLVLLSFSVFSYNHGFYSEPAAFKCSRSVCLVNGDRHIGFVGKIDKEGREFLVLNTSASLVDIDLSEYCFKGEGLELEDIIFALAENTNAELTNGGHFRVGGIGIVTSKSVMRVVYREESDYSQYPEHIYSDTPSCLSK